MANPGYKSLSNGMAKLGEIFLIKKCFSSCIFRFFYSEQICFKSKIVNMIFAFSRPQTYKKAPTLLPAKWAKWF